MIIDALFQLIGTILIGVVSLLPAYTNANGGVITTAIEWFSTFFAAIIYVMPTGENIALVAGAYLVFHVALWTWENLKMILNFIRGSGM